MSSPSPVRPAAIEIGEELLPFGGAFARRQAEIDDLLLAVVAQPQGHENRPAQRAGAGLAGEHDAVEHQSLVAVLQRPPMERGHRGIQRLGDLAHRCGAHRTSEQGKQCLSHLAGRQPEHEAGKDDPVDLARAPRIGADDLNRAVAPGPGNVEFNVAEFGQKMPSIVPIAAVRSVIGLELIEMTIDCGRHLIFDDLLQGLPAEWAITLAPIQAVRLHRLHDLKGHR